ncbi:MAG TPA: hypothetical protein VHR45_04620 [Thermoanaerobaculia bacterium]|nr:hypothetical protein [Thermoanaerobaculia bacterium]
MPALTAQFARHFRNLQLLRGSLIAGALYDAAFAVLMICAPQLPARLLALPLPPLPRGVFYLWIMALLLLMLAALYLLAAHDTRRYSGVVVVAVCGRIAGGLAFLAAAWRVPGLGGLYPLAAADLGLGLAHAAFWQLARP